MTTSEREMLEYKGQGLSISIKPRTELPSCEAIDGKKVKIAYFVIPVTKLKVRVNLGLLKF